MTYRATWLDDNGGNPWPRENEGRWPKERFETYAVIDEHSRVVCVTGRYQPDWEQAKAIAQALNVGIQAVTPERIDEVGAGGWPHET